MTHFSKSRFQFGICGLQIKLRADVPGGDLFGTHSINLKTQPPDRNLEYTEPPRSHEETHQEMKKKNKAKRGQGLATAS